LSEESGVETVVRKIKDKTKGKTNLDEVVDIINESRVNDLKNITVERLMEEEKAKLEEARKKQQPPNAGVATDFLGHIMTMAQVDPKRAKDFLNSLTEEDVAKLSMLSASGQGTSMMNLIPFLKTPGVDIKSIVEIVKMMQPQPQPSMDAKVIAEVFKAGIELAKAQQPQGTQMQQFEIVKAIIQPFYETLSQRDQQIWEERLKNIESKIVDPLAYFQNLKEGAKELGLTTPPQTGLSPDVQIKLKEMELNQAREIETMKFNREQWAAKFNADQMADQKRWQVVENLMQGPLGRVVETMGKAAAGKIQEGPQQTAPKPILIQCPKCSGTFYGSSDAKIVICPNCKTTLQQAPIEGAQQTVPPPAKTEQPATESSASETAVE